MGEDGKVGGAVLGAMAAVRPLLPLGARPYSVRNVQVTCRWSVPPREEQLTDLTNSHSRPNPNRHQTKSQRVIADESGNDVLKQNALQFRQ